MRNCVDIVRPFVEAVDGHDDIQIIGGIGSAALAESRTIIVPEEKRIIAPSSLKLPQYREDGNMRDFDALVLSSDSVTRRYYQGVAEDTIDDQLELSVFDLKSDTAVSRMRRAPLRHMFQFVSDRYVDEFFPRQISVPSRVLYPFSAEIDPASLETWRLFIGEADKHPAPVPHPGTVITNYLTRSVSGLRPKDEAKVNQMTGAITSKMPDVLDWLYEGPGKSQMEFAGILQKLSRDGSLVVGESVVVKPAEGDLAEHPGFMAADESAAVQHLLLRMSYAKSRGLRFFESNQTIVKLWQRYGEKRAGKIVHND
jgi:hypothetical protein